MKSNRLQTTDYRLQTGFTLVELIIYLGIVALLLTSVSYLIIDLMSGQTGSRADEEVNYNVRLIADRLAADIAAAQQIVSLTSDRLTLDLPGDDVTYEFPSGRTVLTRLVGISGVLNKVNITSLPEPFGRFSPAAATWGLVCRLSIEIPVT